MEKKKHPHADLEKKRFVLFQVGLVVSMSLCLLAFEWTTSGSNTLADITWDTEEVIEIEMPITKPRPPEQPKEEKVEQKPSETIKAVEQVVQFIESPEPEPDFDPGDWFTDSPDPGPAAGNSPAETEPFFIVENMPCFCECEDQPTEAKRQECSEKIRLKYLGKSIKYPWDAKENGKQGTVYVSFVVDAAGQLKNVELAKGVFRSLDAEALRAVKNLPCYSPGKQRGKKVPVRFTMPINFELRN